MVLDCIAGNNIGHFEELQWAEHGSLNGLQVISRLGSADNAADRVGGLEQGQAAFHFATGAVWLGSKLS